MFHILKPKQQLVKIIGTLYKETIVRCGSAIGVNNTQIQIQYQLHEWQLLKHQ